jgi:hypothetical protein
VHAWFNDIAAAAGAAARAGLRARAARLRVFPVIRSAIVVEHDASWESGAYSHIACEI